MMHHGADYTPYEGMEIQDWPKTVILRGQVVYEGEGNKILGQVGDGEFIKRGLSTLP
jgi:dihydropyrimidinase